MTPYYDKDGIKLYCCDCRDVLPRVSPERVRLLLTDPPYGMSLDTHNSGRTALARSKDYSRVIGDDVAFDPSHLLKYKRSILFGANHYADKLPASAGWIVWDKVAGLKSKRDFGFNTNSDAELAWTNIIGSVRLVHIRWMGINKTGENSGRLREHPTEKPIDLAQVLIKQFTDTGELVLDPYVGVGWALIAAKRLGRLALGMEIDERYCEITARRLDETPLPLLSV